MTAQSITAGGIPTARARAVLTVVATAALALPATALAHGSERHPADLMAQASAISATGLERGTQALPLEDIARRGAAAPLLEQHTRRGGGDGGGNSGGGRQAVPRGGSAAPAGGGSSAGGNGGGNRGGSGAGAGTATGRSAADPGRTTSDTGSRDGARTRNGGGSNEDGADTPTYSRPRNGRPATGTAVERRRGDRPPVIIDRGGYYGGLYPWGWGGLGLGGYYGYYDPWGWYDPYPPAVYAGRDYDYDGAVRIKVKPRDAEVYVDGYFAGEVDDYDGVFQKLRLDSGPHRIEVRMEGYEPLTFEVRIQPDRTITYKGELKKADGTN